MTATLHPASTDRRLRRLATRWPEWFAVLASLAFGLPLLAFAVLDEQVQQVTATPGLFLMLAWSVVVPAFLLTALGWWGTAGFTRRSTWRSLVPFLPLILLFVALPLLALVSGPGVADHSPGYLTLVALTMLAVAFSQEAMFRGVVLQTLMPRGAIRAALLSSVLYGVVNTGSLAPGRDPVLVGVQVLAAVGMGVAFAAVVVVTGTIWPLVAINTVTLVAFMLPYGDDPAAATDPTALVSTLVAAALTAAYGAWLLRRHQHRQAAARASASGLSLPR